MATTRKGPEMTTYNVAVVSFEQAASTYEALSKVKELEAQGQIAVQGAAVVERDQDGRLTVKDQVQDPHLAGTTAGGLIGLLVGILGGPFGILIGGTTGLIDQGARNGATVGDTDAPGRRFRI